MDADEVADGRSSVDLVPPRRAMAIGAHPDDVEFGCGATLAKWAAAGTRIVHLICTDGSKGTWDPSADLDALVARRRDEQREASSRLGGDGTVEFLDRTDGELVDDAPTRRLVCEAIRRHRPDVVLAHDPWKRYRLHPDHREAGLLAVHGIVEARDPHFHPDQLEGPDALTPHRPSALLLFEADEVNHVETASPSTLASRIAALEAHTSQFETTHHSRLGDDVDPVLGFRAREQTKLEKMGTVAGVDLGEAFHLMRDL
ncbi:MAG TPA: PIG-L deacetylase family protein [Microthrixaceae bacterium]|nr:PIG-L deacetylase family protein [Microthrixaceae bacterium]